MVSAGSRYFKKYSEKPECVQAAIGKVGGVALLSHGGIWSSSEKDSQNAWMLYVPAGSSFYGLGSNNKTGIDYVRPVLEF